MHEMKVGEASFPLHTIDLNNAKVLIRPEQAEGAKGKNVIIEEERPKNVNNKILARKVVLEKTPDGKESLKITLRASRPGGQASSSQNSSRPVIQVRPVRQPLRSVRPVTPRADPKYSSPSAQKWVLGM